MILYRAMDADLEIIRTLSNSHPFAIRSGDDKGNEMHRSLEAALATRDDWIKA